MKPYSQKTKLLFILFYFWIWLFATMAQAVETPPASSAPASEPGSETRYVTIDFDEVDITVFIKYISELTGKNFIIDKSVKGNITVISPTKISEADAYQVFESVLEVQGFTTVPSGSIIKIVPAVQARSKNVETGFLLESESPRDKVVTQLIPLQHADPEQLKKVFAPLVSKTSVVISYTPTGMLIVTDVMSNIKRLLHIIKEIDVPALAEGITVLPLQHASAMEIAKSLAILFEKTSGRAHINGGVKGVARTRAAQAPQSDVKIIPDERINALIILASEDDTKRIKHLVVLLDEERPRGEGDIHVYYLQNADAEGLSSVLTSLPTKDAKAGEKGKAPIISKEVQIVADKATNSLVITAKKSDYLVIEDVIKKLDIPRRMVYLEALIMEVNVDKEFSLGVEWQGGFTFNEGDYAAFGGSRLPNESTSFTNLLASATLPKGLSLGVLGKTINIAGQEFPSIGAILHAFKNDSDVHIISTPQILTTDNQEAEIKVGENVPYITSQNTTAANQDYTNYEYRDVGVTLRITPQINQEGVVQMEIYTEVIKLVDPGENTPSTLKRTANTTVIVKDLNTVVIGGIIGDDIGEGEFKVPLLGDIPLLGWLFKTKTSSRERTNLYIFLTPRIIKNPAQATEIYREKKEDADWHHEKGFTEPFLRKNTGNQESMLYEEGFQYLQAKEYDKAREYYERILISNPKDPMALINMGVIYEAKGDAALAAIMYEKVVTLNPADRAATSTDPSKEGKTLADIARDNLNRLKGR